MRDELDLEPNKYQVKLGQTIAAEDVIYPDHKLAIPGESSKKKLNGIEVKDPTFGVDLYGSKKHWWLRLRPMIMLSSSPMRYWLRI